MEKKRIQNRKGQTIVVALDILPNAKGLAFIAHGRSGFKEEPHIQAIADAFIESHYSVVRWDARDTLGESDGNIENATPTSYFEDLETVIAWSQSMAWYQEPFILAGHSLGSFVITLYAEKNAEKIKALAPTATNISGKSFMEECGKKLLSKWREKGYLEVNHPLKKSVTYKLNWHYVQDYQQYDLMPLIGRLEMPVLLVIGEKDDTPEYRTTFYQGIPSKRKELHTIPKSGHVFMSDAELTELKRIFENWLKKLN